ncbi:hypothetical protein FEE95_12010 [Maribacter algarum]|uniref:Putative auto-transporter adhesin head GIN domain-containing protein n=1 Tax=Maribacter algarum (ex Zhang et al. 2020) TaxID=2578118 RepID=A0A5S3PR34_9FLAO|nr:DUF2807 domain-containing protein [Maribacter algarum]TMM57207.1 hypothetical protein FEE95_12010 [Maribacter algarum]
MKKLILLLLLVAATGLAQVKGNKDIQTRTFTTENLTDIEIGFYADIIIDHSAAEKMVITIDSNLFDLIDTEVVDGKLKLDQKEWIQASERIKIRIGAPNLKRIQQGTNDIVRITNVTSKNFSAMALNGEIVISGQVNSLGIGAENGIVDASKTKADEVFLNIWGHGKAIVNAFEFIDAKLSKDSKLELVSKPKKVRGNIEKALANNSIVSVESIRYIDFKIKNNSSNRNNFYVIGPKPDGRNFSYGFPMMPGKVRKEKWTTGTKIYKVNRIGLRKHLVTIMDKDEDKIVRLFNN